MESFLAIDFETGDQGSDSAISIGLVRVENDQIVAEKVQLIRPPRERVMFTSIHGLTWNDVKDSPHFGEAWPSLKPFFEGVSFLVAHNAPFDRRVLYGCCETYGIERPTQPFQCTVQVARKAFDIYPTKLSNVCEALSIDLNHHEALSDARAAAKIYLAAEKILREKNAAPLAFLKLPSRKPLRTPPPIPAVVETVPLPEFWI
jgi:DNA polymerase-3 subunit epsilon